MKLRTLLFASSLALATTAIDIDPTLPDGVYYAHPDPASPGRVLHRRFVTGDPEHDHYYRSRTLQEVVPIAKGKLFCRNGEGDGKEALNRTFDLGDYYAAVNALFEAPLFWVPESFARYALRGRNPASLLEYMAAMAEADARCGEGVAAKRTMVDWNKWYGREARGHPICKYEHDPRGIPNDLLWWEERGCRDYVNGIRRGVGEPGKCNDNAVGDGLYEKLRRMFPWYKAPLGRGGGKDEARAPAVKAEEDKRPERLTGGAKDKGQGQKANSDNTGAKKSHNNKQPETQGVKAKSRANKQDVVHLSHINVLSASRLLILFQTIRHGFGKVKKSLMEGRAILHNVANQKQNPLTPTQLPNAASNAGFCNPTVIPTDQ
ncbi:hypothetical protein HJFPF1_08096 [Paramyrothecium foliicola]|nr:hypothetical protein HJFPF1_08096 [Paramyrothecium foliicola]